MDSPANHRSPWAKLCHYRFSISFRRFFFPFSFSSFFSSFLRPPSLLHESKYTVPSYFPSPSSSSFLFFYPFLLLLFSFFPLPFALPICVHRFSACRKVLPEVRRFYYRFASLTRRPIFTKKKKRKDDSATRLRRCYYSQTSCNIYF